MVKIFPLVPISYCSGFKLGRNLYHKPVTAVKVTGEMNVSQLGSSAVWLVFLLQVRKAPSCLREWSLCMWLEMMLIFGHEMAGKNPALVFSPS